MNSFPIWIVIPTTWCCIHYNIFFQANIGMFLNSCISYNCSGVVVTKRWHCKSNNKHYSSHQDVFNSFLIWLCCKTYNLNFLPVHIGTMFIVRATQLQWFSHEENCCSCVTLTTSLVSVPFLFQASSPMTSFPIWNVIHTTWCCIHYNIYFQANIGMFLKSCISYNCSGVEVTKRWHCKSYNKHYSSHKTFSTHFWTDLVVRLTTWMPSFVINTMFVVPKYSVTTIFVTVYMLW